MFMCCVRQTDVVAIRCTSTDTHHNFYNRFTCKAVSLTPFIMVSTVFSEKCFFSEFQPLGSFIENYCKNGWKLQPYHIHSPRGESKCQWIVYEVWGGPPHKSTVSTHFSHIWTQLFNVFVRGMTSTRQGWHMNGFSAAWFGFHTLYRYST